MLSISISFSFLLLNGCSSLPQFSSEVCTKKIVIDGDNSEWNGIPSYIDKNNVLAVSVCHDDEYVYVCMITQDSQTQRQIMGGGLTVWFDRTGSDDKTFGINFPLGRHTGGASQRMNEETRRDFDTARQVMDQTTLEMEIIGSKETDRYLLPLVNNEGIQAKIGKLNGREMVYELQVPLKKTAGHPNAIEPKKDFIGLGFETGAIASPSGKRKGEHSGSPGESEGSGPSSQSGMGRGHRGGGSSGGGKMHQGGASKSTSIPEPVNMWWKVKL